MPKKRRVASRDNRTKFARVTGVRELIAARDAKLLYLPAYSPDFSPIEPC